MSIDTILFIGRPGAGKGTQARILTEKGGFKLYSSGDQMRAIQGENTPLGDRVRSLFQTGKLLPDWFAEHLFEKNLFELQKAERAIFDGFGRTKQQAIHFIERCEWLNRIVRVVYLDVPEEEVVRRMRARAQAEDRSDSDTDEKIMMRIKKFDDFTLLALDVFMERGMVITINGMQSPEEVHTEIMKSLQGV